MFAAAFDGWAGMDGQQKFFALLLACLLSTTLLRWVHDTLLGGRGICASMCFRYG